MSAANKTAVSTINYNRSKLWQIALFSLNNTATNAYLLTINLISYYLVGYAGLATAMVGTLLTALRIFDGITDPIIGALIDRTNGKLGKFRPYMITGYTIMTVAILIMFNFTHRIYEAVSASAGPGTGKMVSYIFFVVMYMIYIIGYTCQTACTKSGQSCMTNDPSQRPLFSAFDSPYTLLLFAGFPALTSMVLIPKYGDHVNNINYTLELFSVLVPGVIIFSGVLTALAVIGIWSKDVPENFGLGKEQKFKFKDYVQVIKKNRGLQMLIVSASTDKISGLAASNPITSIMIYGIIMGNNTLQGKLSLITLIPAFILVQFFSQYARKLGIRKGMVTTAIACIVVYAGIWALLIFGDPHAISLENVGFMTIAYLVLWSLGQGISRSSGGLTINAISDVTDYETYRSGNYMPGIIGTIFSFVDKIISAFSTTIVSLAVAAIGYKNTQPATGDPLTPQIFWVGTFLFLGLPILGWIASVIALKFYPLTAEKMKEIQLKIADIKAGYKEEEEARQLGMTVEEYREAMAEQAEDKAVKDIVDPSQL